MQDSIQLKSEITLGQRVHFVGDPRRTGTVAFVGTLEGYSGAWIGVDWDDNNGKHDGSINGVRYFEAKSERSGSFVRVQNLSFGISLLQALELRYRGDSTKEEEDEMYVLSASDKRVSIQFVGKDIIKDKLSRFEELTSVSLSYMGVSSLGNPCQIGSVLPNLKQLDLTGNLLSDWKDISIICDQLQALTSLILSNNLLSRDISGPLQLKHIRILVLNNTGIIWMQVEILKQSLPAIEELHLMGNNISAITPVSSPMVQGFNLLRLLNLENNRIAEWNEILKLCQLRSLEQIQLNNNKLSRIFYPCLYELNELFGGVESPGDNFPFQNLRCLLLGGNNIEDFASIDCLNSFPQLIDIRLSENLIADPGRGGIPRYVLIARLSKVQIINGSEVTPRERRDSEIRYVRMVMSKLDSNPEETLRLHPRFEELKSFHGIEDNRLSVGPAGPQKLASGLISITLKCVGASIGEKPPLTKKLPPTTSVGKLKMLCESFFKLKCIKLKLYLQEQDSPVPIPLEDDMASLMDLGVGNESNILVDEES
ncbi:tubulin-folding cofactor E [Momordica charantia]|uniref:Tubulin-folding cofactor E n=1 Tax=Momordica charantia TaxID=3673 RepID=A0A6J1DEY9_MOMCH|nr:tubulin-folding cofactor E [Momordica charantia]XP_022152478.1 tubulin-folding cofactor E [Momordica charantia]